MRAAAAYRAKVMARGKVPLEMTLGSVLRMSQAAGAADV
jgi:hypothetical protein